MKLNKVKVEAKTRALSANYTIELSEEIESILGDELQKAIDDEVMNNIIGPTLIEDNWTHIYLRNYEQVTTEWLKENMSDTYKMFGSYWYFKSKKDAMTFSLRWK